MHKLQWGRVRKNAESIAKMMHEAGVKGFNGAAFGRTRKAGEAGLGAANQLLLQWGRVRKNAESPGGFRAWPGVGASMGPRSEERGKSGLFKPLPDRKLCPVFRAMAKDGALAKSLQGAILLLTIWLSKSSRGGRVLGATSPLEGSIGFLAPLFFISIPLIFH